MENNFTCQGVIYPYNKVSLAKLVDSIYIPISTEAQLTYKTSIEILSIEPTVVDLSSETTVFKIVGRNLMALNTYHTSCLFTHSSSKQYSVPATVIDQTTLECQIDHSKLLTEGIRSLNGMIEQDFYIRSIGELINLD